MLTAALSAAAVTPIEIDFEVESGPVITKVSSTPNGLNDVPGTGNDGNTPMSPDLGASWPLLKRPAPCPSRPPW